MTARCCVVFALAVACVIAGPAAAQTRTPADPRLPGRLEISAGVSWTGKNDFGVRNANETTPNGSTLLLFSTTSELAPAAGGELRVGVRLTRLLQAEGDATYAAPTLRVRVTGDSENAPAVTATDRIAQFTAGGTLLVHLTRWPAGARGLPFVSGGAGYLRQLYSTRTLARVGQVYHFGGGVKHSLMSRSSRARLKGAGVRLDARAVVRTKGVALDNRTHVAPAIAGSLFVRF